MYEEKRNERWSEPNEDLARIISYTFRGQICPMMTIIGGFVAQEIQKAVIGVLMPLKQWFHIDFTEDVFRGLTVHPSPEDAHPNERSRYDGLIRCFGKKFQEKLAAQKVMIVGLQTLGREFLKNFAMLGVGLKKFGGQIFSCDEDVLEISNNFRHFFYRERNVSKPLPVCYSELIRREMNSEVNMVPLTKRLHGSNDDIYNLKFFESISCVFNAIDSVEARKYVGSKCMMAGVPLIDTGASKSKGHVQAIIPQVTELLNLDDEVEEEENDEYERNEITGKIRYLHPENMNDCIKKARRLFRSLFIMSPLEAKSYLENPNQYTEDILNDFKNGKTVLSMEKLDRLESFLEFAPKNFTECIEYSKRKFESIFRNDILSVLHKHPPGSVDETSGVGYWLRRSEIGVPPSPLELSLKTPSGEVNYGVEFIRSCSELLSGIFGICDVRDVNFREELEKMGFLGNAEPPIGDLEEGEDSMEKFRSRISKLDELRKKFGVSHEQITPIGKLEVVENHDHLDFIISCAKNFSFAYKVFSQMSRWKMEAIIRNDRSHSKPPFLTTSSMVTGFACIEYLKSLLETENTVAKYRNSYINLALPSIIMSEPMEPKKNKYGARSGKQFSDWDFFRVEVKEDISIRGFLDHFKDEHKISVEQIIWENSMIYFDGGGGELGLKDRKVAESCFQVVEDGKEKCRGGVLVLEILGEGVEDEDVYEELPRVLYFVEFM